MVSKTLLDLESFHDVCLFLLMSQSIAGSTEKGTETGNEKKDENTTEAEAAAPGLRNIISKRNFTTKKIYNGSCYSCPGLCTTSTEHETWHFILTCVIDDSDKNIRQLWMTIQLVFENIDLIQHRYFF